MRTSGSREHQVVVGGGGFGGLQAVSNLRRAPVEITLVDRRNLHLFQPLTYQVATGALSPGEIAYPLRAIFKCDRNVRVLLAEVADFDLDARELHLQALRQTAGSADVALIGWAILVGASLVAGALVAVVLRLPERIAAVVTSFGGGLLVAAIAFELVPEADERAGAVVTALGLLAGTLVYVGADAWLTRDEAMAEMRRSGQAAAAGQPMTMSVDHAEAARGESIAVGLFVDGCRSRSRWA